MDSQAPRYDDGWRGGIFPLLSYLQVGKLPCLEISQSTTAFGRMMIEETKNQVGKIFS